MLKLLTWIEVTCWTDNEKYYLIPSFSAIGIMTFNMIANEIIAWEKPMVNEYKVLFHISLLIKFQYLFTKRFVQLWSKIGSNLEWIHIVLTDPESWNSNE